MYMMHIIVIARVVAYHSENLNDRDMIDFRKSMLIPNILSHVNGIAENDDALWVFIHDHVFVLVNTKKIEKVFPLVQKNHCMWRPILIIKDMDQLSKNWPLQLHCSSRLCNRTNLFYHHTC